MQIIEAGQSVLRLGRQGENLARQVRFPAAKYRELYGDGTFALIARRETDSVPYPVSVTADESWVYWDLSDVDTAVAGQGACELQYYVGQVLAKSQTWRTQVYPSLGDAGEDPPDPYESWVEDVTRTVALAVDEAQAAQSAAEMAQAAAEDAQAAAETAQSRAENAQVAAETAQGLAEDAQGEAENRAAAAAASATAAAISAAAAQTALEGMIYVTFDVDEDGHIIIQNGDLLGTTSFRLIPPGESNEGHLEVDY